MKLAKAAIRSFLRTAYTDEGLVKLLDHARSGNLSYQSCCCLVGAATADHADGQLHGIGLAGRHLEVGRALPGAIAAEMAYQALAAPLGHIRIGCAADAASLIEAMVYADVVRRRRLIPMLLAEMRRRGRARAAELEPVAVEVRA